MKKKPYIVALIPAREGSQNIKNKNIRLLGKHPLIAYSIKAALLSNYLNDVFVTTDSEKIAKISNKYGAQTPFLRPKKISGNNSIDIEFFNHFLKYLNNQNYKIPDLIVHLSPTVPLREKNIIDKSINYILKNPKATSLRSVNKIDLSPYKIFYQNNNYLKGFFNELKFEYYNLPRQKYPDTYKPNGHVDIVKPEYITEKNLHGNKILSFITNPVIDIDSFKDLNEAKKILSDKKFSYLLEELK